MGKKRKKNRQKQFSESSDTSQENLSLETEESSEKSGSVHSLQEALSKVSAQDDDDQAESGDPLLEATLAGSETEQSSEEKPLHQESPHQPAPESHSGEPDSDNQTIGSYINSQFRKTNITLRVVSQKTRISHSILTALVEEDFSKLPDLTYLKGFIKSICKEIAIPHDKALEILTRDYEKYKESIEEPVQIETPLKNPFIPDKDPAHRSLSGKVSNFMSPTAWLAAGGLVFVLVIVAIFVNIESKSKNQTTAKKAPVKEVPPTKNIKIEQKVAAVKETQVEYIHPTPKVPSNKVIAEEQKRLLDDASEDSATSSKPLLKPEPESENMEKPEEVAKPTDSENTSEKPAEESVAVKEEDPSEQEEDSTQEAEDGKLSINIRPFDKPLFKLDPNAKEVGDPEILAPRFKASVINNKQNVLVHAHEEDTWLTYKSDEEEVRNFVLKKGRSVLIRGDDVRLFLGNARAAKVFLNNQLVRYKAPSGVKSLVFPIGNTNKYKLPLFIYDKKEGQMLTTEDFVQKYKDKQ